MNEIASSAFEAVCESETVAPKAINLIKEILEATNGVTAPQAVMLVGTATVFTVGACYCAGKISNLIEQGYIETLDFKNKTIAFNNLGSAAA